jgi:hypothetical protein
MALRLIILIFLACTVISDTFSPTNPFLRRRLMRTSKEYTHGMLDDSIDISENLDGGIMKQIVRTGDDSKGLPLFRDTVKIAWMISLTNGSVVHVSDRKDSPFSFAIGASPREVIRGWELAVQRMYEGEISKLVIQPSYAFGTNGVPPMIPPDAIIVCELELLEIVPSVQRTYKSVGMNESIKDELLEKIESGETIVSKEVVDSGNKSTNGTSVRMFDEKTMKLNPNQVRTNF